mgnify:CR=1 FL=1
MKRQPMGPVLGPWFKGMDEAPPDARACARAVLARLPEVQQRGRRWPLPAFERPAPIPTTNGRPPARGFTMLSALKFMVASVIVALFGGFLLAGILYTQPSDEMTPAVVTESPSPVTTEELLSGMVTEGVEPGVFRVVNDGVRDLVAVEGVDLVAGQDDGIWLVREDHFLRLGSDAVHEWPGERPDLPWDDSEVTPPWYDFEVTPDGTVWTAIETDADLEGGPQDSGVNLWSYDGSEWVSRLPTYLLDGPIDLTSDGTLWAVWLSDSADYGNGVFGYLGADGWTAVGEWPYPGSSPYVSDEGEVWAFGGAQMMDGQVHRFVDGTWLDDGPRWASGDVGPDGTVWVDSSGGFQRFDGTGWTPFGMPDWRWGSDWGDVRVAPDGSVWVAARLDVPGGQVPACGQGVGGVAHFDGMAWDRYLPGRCVIAFDIAAHGSVWVLADDGLYVITPEAVAASEAEVIEPPSVEEPTDAGETSTTTNDLLSGMVTEEVEPGVYRVINDGVRDLANANDTDIVAGEDGDIYLLRPQRFVRLGSDEWQAWDTEDFHIGDFEVAKEGGVWTSAIESVAGEEWTPLEGSIVTAVDMAPDGTVWAFWEDRWQDPAVQRRAVFAYLDEDGWQTLGHLDRVNDLLVAGPDDIWATAGLWPRNYLHRFADGAWQRLVGFEGTEPTWQPAEEPVADDTEQFDHGPDGGVGLGPDGTLWGVRLGDDFDLLDLVRFDGSGWSRWSLDDSLLDAGFIPAVASPLRVASDGSIWFAAMEPPDDYGSLWFAVGEPWDDFCDGVGHFDGVTPDRFLSDLCVKTVDITADGAVWLLANEPDADLRHVYVITPEAVAE